MDQETLAIQELIEKFDEDIIGCQESLALAVSSSEFAKQLLLENKETVLREIGDHLTSTNGFEQYLLHSLKLQEGWTLLLVKFREKYQIIGTSPKYMEWNEKIVWCFIHENN